MNTLIEEYLKRLNQESLFAIDSPQMIKRSNVENINLDNIANRALHPEELKHKQKYKR